MSFSVLAGQVFVFLLIILLGLLIQKLGVVDEHATKKISDLVVAVLMPATMLNSVAAGREGGGSDLVICAVAMGAYYLVSILLTELTCKVTKMHWKKRAVVLPSVVFPNIAFIGIPMVSALLGDHALVYLVIGMTFYNVIFFAYVPFLFEKNGRLNWRNFVTPINVTAVVTGFLMVTGISLPALLQSFIKQVSQATSPLALFLIGAMLGRSNLWKVLRNWQLLLTSCTRLLLFPLSFAFAISFLNLDPTLFIAMVICVACPAGTFVAVLALQKDVLPELASESVVHSTTLSIVLMPVVIWVAGFM